MEFGNFLPDSNNYIEKITKDLDISVAFASQQAGIALRNLIHNYNIILE
jgi:hypothetical protein